jgi:hypothetical protein
MVDAPETTVSMAGEAEIEKSCKYIVNVSVAVAEVRESVPLTVKM